MLKRFSKVSSCKLSNSQYANVRNVVKTMTKMTSGNIQGGLAVLVLKFQTLVNEFSFENLRQTNNTGERKNANIQIQKSNSNGMRIFEHSLPALVISVDFAGLCHQC